MLPTVSSIQNTVRWRSRLLDGAIVTCCLGTPGQTKVSGDRHKGTTHEICYLAAEYSILTWEKMVGFVILIFIVC